MNLNSILTGSADPQRLADYYSRLFGAPGWVEGGYTGWQIGTGFVTEGLHDQVHGNNLQPGRIIWNIKSADVQADFARFREAGATVVQEPYRPGEASAEAPEVRIATFSDPDDNYFHLMSAMSM